MTAIEIDARGLRCPLPVIRLAAAALDAPPGTRITVLATDPAARHDIPAWCRMRDQELIEMTSESGPSVQSGLSDPSVLPGAGPAAAGDDTAYLRFVVVVRAQASKATGAGSGNARRSRAR